MVNDVVTRGHLLSNGQYGVLVTEAGGGFSALRGFALTRWQPDPISEPHGVFCYLRDLGSGIYSSSAHSDLSCTTDRVEQKWRLDAVEATCAIGVLRGMNAEKRRITITNKSVRPRQLELTTYAELSLNSPAADAAHPAFSKLFVQTAFDAERSALLAWRRLRSPHDRPLWVGQQLRSAGSVEFETERAAFIGRTRSPLHPLAMLTNEPLNGNTGAVLDPIFSMRTRFELDPGASIDFELLLCAADTRAEVEQLLDFEHELPYASSSDPLVLGLPEKWRANIDLYPTLTVARGDDVTNSQERLPQRRERFGGISADGKEYVIEVGLDLEPTPQPWINVIANEQCGLLVSETGAGYTWASNSRENRITTWSNDAVTDTHSEALYLRDDDDGAFWSILPGPVPERGVYEVRHGFGYSVFSSNTRNLNQTATLFVPRHDPLRITRLEVTNESDRTRRLSLISYHQLVLGGLSAETRATIHTAHESDVIFARNPERGEFSERVAFATAICGKPARRAATASRRSFIGSNRTLVNPLALTAESLDEQFGTDIDPCAALQLSIFLEPGETLHCAFLLGEADDEVAARQCLERYQSIADVDAAFDNVTAFWNHLLTAVQVRTPVPALDTMFNGWLAYQNLACRMWARSAFYQSGGAFGFRDQLQDSSALLYLDPDITRRQILLHAAHQFQEGDVLHWWHPPSSKGIRTRFSDDLLWLPHIAQFYIARTGDEAVLDEDIRYITAPPLSDDEDEIFVWPSDSGESGNLYEHCCRAIDRSLTKGAHDLPLMGVGDWNDGMNRVGRKGRGESVWLGFFLFDILTHWIGICEQRVDLTRVKRYRTYKSELHKALNDAGWDGSWYRRAYYDDGTPLGSAQNDECRIDALAQAWAVISGAAPSKRAKQALSAMHEHLVTERDGIIRLLTPPFDKTRHDPGYIKGYVPGVRENGGQYTHAALWAIRALAEHGESERAAALLEMISPLTRSQNPAVYRGEPYVIAADVYGEPPHVGRAGWTWYTGSAGWMYRVFLESILGFELVHGQMIRLQPCIPASWPGYSLRYTLPDGTIYTLEVEQVDGSSSTSEGEVENGAIVIPLTLDGGEHTVRIRAGADVRPRYQPAASDAPLLRTTSA